MILSGGEESDFMEPLDADYVPKWSPSDAASLLSDPATEVGAVAVDVGVTVEIYVGKYTDPVAQNRQTGERLLAGRPSYLYVFNNVVCPLLRPPPPPTGGVGPDGAPATSPPERPAESGCVSHILLDADTGEFLLESGSF